MFSRNLAGAAGMLTSSRRYATTERRSGLVVREEEHRIKGRDRNQPCPCGSGRKAKRCHGR